jgi:hypothetical protein
MSQSTGVVEGRSKGLRLLQVSQDSLRLTSGKEGRPQGKPEVDRLFEGIALLWEMR